MVEGWVAAGAVGDDEDAVGVGGFVEGGCWGFAELREFGEDFGGKVVVLAGQRVLSLSRTRARIVGMRCWMGFSGGVGGWCCLRMRCGPRSSGRYVNVGMVRCGRNWEGCLRSVCTAWLKPRRLELGEPAMARM